MNDCPLFQQLKEKVFEFYDIEKDQMGQFIKNYKCLTSEKLEKHWHHSDILT